MASSTYLFLVLQNVAVSGGPLFKFDDCLVGILHGDGLDPRLDILGGGELEHLVELGRGTDQRATDLDAVGDEGEGVDGRKVATVGSTDLDKGTADLEKGEVLGHGHLLTADSADDQVESARVLLGPVLVLSSGDVLVGTELEDVVTLVVLARDTDNAVSTESLGEEDTEVTETTNTDDTDGLAGTTAVALQGAVDGDTTAKHGGSSGAVKTFGDLDDELAVGSVVVGVTTVGLALVVGVDTTVGVDGLLAVGLVAVLAVDALEASLCLGTNTNAVADLDVLDLGSDTDGLSDNLVADAARVRGRAPAGAQHVNVATADTAVGDLDVDVGLLPLLSCLLDKVQQELIF